jgi:hypothetical protein
MEYLQLMQQKDPSIEQRMRRTENHTRAYEQSTLLRSEQTIVIPVVVHILFNTTSEKLSAEITQSQIDVLNEDYQRLNTDQTNQWNQAANVNIEFQLATVAPDGSPTNGIISKFTPRSFFYANDEMKFDQTGGSNAWPTDKYLNIWVCDLLGNKIGVGQFPEGGDYETDGVVIDYLAFGRTYNSSKYGLGRTATHEVGHWLNLRHVWGDGDCQKDDYVSDTPNSSYPSFGCQPGKTTCGTLDMIANFMDYSNDQCMNLFTEGQKNRMRALFSPGGFRASILKSPGLGQVNTEQENPPIAEQCPGGVNCEEENPENNVGCASPTQLSANFEDRKMNISWKGSAEVYTFEVQLPNSSRWYSFSTKRDQLSISGLTVAMVQKARLKANCTNGLSSPYVYFNLGGNRLMESIAPTDFQAYPNPVRSSLFVNWTTAAIHFNGLEFDSTEDSSPVALELYDRSGRLTLQVPIVTDQNSAQLDVSNLNLGLYFLIQRGRNGQIIANQKIQVL